MLRKLEEVTASKAARVAAEEELKRIEEKFNAWADKLDLKEGEKFDEELTLPVDGIEAARSLIKSFFGNAGWKFCEVLQHTNGKYLLKITYQLS